MNNGILVRNPFHPSLFLHWRSKASSQDSSVGYDEMGWEKPQQQDWSYPYFITSFIQKNDHKNKVWKNIDSSPEIGQNWSKLVKTFAKIGEEMVNMVKIGQKIGQNWSKKWPKKWSKNWSKHWSKLVKHIGQNWPKLVKKIGQKIGQNWSKLKKW